MCYMPHPKHKAVVALPAPAAAPAVASSPLAKPVHKIRPTYPTHPSGPILDIVGIAAGIQGCRCKEHKVCCGKVA